MRTTRCVVAALVSVAGMSAAASAQTIVTPTTPETSGLNTALRSLPRQYMEYFDDSQLSGITGQVNIIGMKLRVSASVQNYGAPPQAWPFANLTWTSFQMQMSEA